MSEINPFDALSEREKPIAAALALGLKNSLISVELGIAIKTVGAHRASILRKVGASSNVELARLAIKWGVVPAP
jgi:DNA-binding NarL/FixJ family response regulator